MELHGVTGSPYKHPETRRTLPAPFERPSITVGGAKARKRVWRDTPVAKLQPGDTVANIGVVQRIEELVRIPAPDTCDEEPPGEDVWIITITNVMGEGFDMLGHQRVFAFTGVHDEPTR